MASANVELVRSIFAAWERGDFSSTEWAHPDIEIVLADGPDPGRWTGLAGLAEAWRSRIGAFEDYRGVAEEFRELDDERILVFHRRSGRGRKSGLEIGHMGAGGVSLFQVRDGKVTRLVGYLDREHGLADLGLTADAGLPSP